MIYPKFLNNNGTIGVTAPSAGAGDEIDIFRIENATKKLNKLGINIIETPNCRTSFGVRSSDAKTRAKELESLFENNDVDSIVCLAGGEFLVEMLPYIDFDVIKNNPKWLQGFSDVTGISFAITTLLDIATIYGYNFKIYAMEEWHESIKNNLEILKGNLVEQISFEAYENGRVERTTGNELFNLDSKVNWINLNGEEKIEIKGRIIGGCLDLINHLAGTKYENVLGFIEKYKEDGIIWYFDNCELSCEDIIKVMWKFKEMGWFEHTKGIVFGRTMLDISGTGLTFHEAVKTAFDGMNIPIIVDADIGHKPPQMTIINGAIATITSESGKGSALFELK
ncbi:MAG: LD-carboxypeptidase [Clostridia bacterium]|nr:LD-carboxypeptidase [Clostridia bacterium]